MLLRHGLLIKTDISHNNLKLGLNKICFSLYQVQIYSSHNYQEIYPSLHLFQGDSGGPLMCKSKSSGRYTVAGVVSWGKACAEAGFPGIYADVIHYMDWVEWVISKN